MFGQQLAARHAHPGQPVSRVRSRKRRRRRRPDRTGARWAAL